MIDRLTYLEWGYPLVVFRDLFRAVELSLDLSGNWASSSSLSSSLMVSLGCFTPWLYASFGPELSSSCWWRSPFLEIKAEVLTLPQYITFSESSLLAKKHFPVRRTFVASVSRFLACFATVLN